MIQKGSQEIKIFDASLLGAVSSGFIARSCQQLEISVVMKREGRDDVLATLQALDPIMSRTNSDLSFKSARVRISNENHYFHLSGAIDPRGRLNVSSPQHGESAFLDSPWKVGDLSI